MPSSTPDNNEETLRILTHQLRIAEHDLREAELRRRWSDASRIAVPVVVIVIYAMWWIPIIDKSIKTAVTIPLVLILILLAISLYDREEYKKKERGFGLDAQRLRDERKHLLAKGELSLKVRRTAYKEDAFSDIHDFRKRSMPPRRINNFLQGVVIVGSIVATGAASASASSFADSFPAARWSLPIITLAVGISSGFMTAYKFKERSFYLQQTADEIEQEWEAAEVGVGRYREFEENEEKILAVFVDQVHRLKVEQKKRQQHLDQPSESTKSTD